MTAKSELVKGFKMAYQAFVEEHAEEAIINSTELWESDTYHVELFVDGTYRCLYGSEIGNLYESAGIIIGVPSLIADEYNAEEPTLSYFDEALEGLEESFDEAIDRVCGLTY